MARLSPGTLAVAVVAILLALTGAFAVRQLLEEKAAAVVIEEVGEPPKPINVPVTTIALGEGRVIHESDLATVVLAPDKFRASKYAGKMFIGDVTQLVGRVTNREFLPGETVGHDDLYSEGTGPTVAEKLPRGMRAVTVKVSGSGFVDGFAAPGTVVDVLFRSMADSTDSLPETTITALHGIQVLAVDASSYSLSVRDRDASSLSPDASVTFAVLPAQATMLKALEGRGEISLSLRSNAVEDEAVANVSKEVVDDERHAQTLASILEGAKIPLVAVTAAELVQGRVVRASDIRLVEPQPGMEAGNDGSSFNNVESLVGRVLRSDMSSGQVLTAELLYPEGVSPGVAERLPAGFRAVTVKMEQTSLVGGFIAPGTHVDMFFRSEALEGYPETTLRVLEGLQVLAIEDRVAAGGDPGIDAANRGIRVTMAVPLGDVGKIQTLEGHGTMTLAVRAARERSVGEIAGELATAERELQEMQSKVAALEQISQLDDAIKLSQEQKDRLNLLVAEIPKLEQQVASLNAEKNAATTGVSQTTLADVLNLPEPPRAEKLEIYKGGARETLVFSGGVRAGTTARTASNVPDAKARIKSTSVQKEVKPKPGNAKVKGAATTNLEESPADSSARKVSAARSHRSAANGDQVATVFQSTTDGDGSVLWSVAEFGRGLVRGLTTVAPSAPRVEIVRGGIRE